LLTERDAGVGDPVLAVRLATRTTEAEPDCPTYWNTLGAALYRIGDAESCIAAIEHSMALSGGGTPFDFLYIALAHAQLNHREAARHWRDQARAWTPPLGARHTDLIRLEEEVDERFASDLHE
jgi:hypothetical protein